MTKLGLPLTACRPALPLPAVAQDGRRPADAEHDRRHHRLAGAYGRMADPRAVGAGVDFDW